MNTFVVIIVYALILICFFKITNYFFKWIDGKWGRKIRWQINLLMIILGTIALFATGARISGWIVTIPMVCVVLLNLYSKRKLR